MKRIMFVCHGNICRSPMAEFIFKDMVRQAGTESDFIIASSATSTEEIYGGIGNPVYPPAKEELKKHGLSCDNKRAVQLKKEDASNYDMFIGMDSANIRNMKRILGQNNEDKVFLLLNFAGRNDDVSDPWYSGRFDIAYNDIYEGCKALFAYLRNEKESKYGFHN